MPAGNRPGRRPLDRADLPEVFTPETVRRLDIGAIRQLSRRKNGVLNAEDQEAFDNALRTVMQTKTDRLDEGLRRIRRGGPGGLDPQLQRTFERTQRRLAEQADRARQSFPELTRDWEPATTPAVEEATSDEAESGDDEGVSLGSFEAEIDQTADTLEILERIASIEQQQLEHHQSLLLRDARGVFFALLVSVAVIVAGVSPLVEARPHQRALIFIWTVVICVLAGAVYGLIRLVQSPKRSDSSDPSDPD
jgi:hypothetical protein